MRGKIIATGIFAISIIGASAAYAQATTANAGADTTCSDFENMDATAQAEVLAKLDMGDSLSMSDDNANANASANTDSDSDSDSISSVPDAGRAPASDLDPAKVLAACQADSSLTVGEALANKTDD